MDETYSKYSELYREVFNLNIIISYVGIFDNKVLTTIAKNIGAKLSENSQVNKKIFKIFLEFAQNISFYSSEIKVTKDGRKYGVGILIIREYEDHFMFATGNLAENHRSNQVKNKCEMINSLDRQGLRAFKREQRNKPKGEYGGANIGLIHAALVSGNPLMVTSKPIDDKNEFMTIAVKIDK